jgi:hypothetical protein
MRKRTTKKKTKSTLPSLITGHLDGIKRALLEGEKRPAFLNFLDTQISAKRGIYALYDEKGRLHYAGKATDLSRRLNQHLKDQHGDSWDRMTLFLVGDSANVSELEGLLIATARPPGNKQKPKIGYDLRKRLRTYLKKDAVLQIDQQIYPQAQRKSDVLSGRITQKKLKAMRQTDLAKVLGTTQPRVSQLFKTGEIRKYILEAGKRDAVLVFLETAKRKSK